MDVWEERDRAGNTKSLNLMILLSQWKKPLLPSQEINPALPEETATDSLGKAAIHDNGQFFLGPPPLTTLFASRTVTRLKSQQAPKGEVENVTHYSPKEVLEFSNLHRYKSREHVWI